MPILQIERKVLKLWDDRSKYLNASSPETTENIVGEVLATDFLQGLVSLVSTKRNGLSFRYRADVSLSTDEDMKTWLKAQKFALSQVGTEQNFVYRITPDTKAGVKLLSLDYSLFKLLSDGMSGVIIGAVGKMGVSSK